MVETISQKSPPTRNTPQFADIFREYAPFVLRMLKRLGVRPGDVEDVAQEVFVAVHRNLPTFEGRSSLRTWVYGICARTASNYRRSARIRHELATGEVPEEIVNASQEAAIDDKRARLMLDQLLDTLDDEKRLVFVLFDVEEVPMDEVAVIAGVPLQTAYSRLYAARNQLQAHAARFARKEKSL